MAHPIWSLFYGIMGMAWEAAQTLSRTEEKYCIHIDEYMLC